MSRGRKKRLGKSGSRSRPDQQYYRGRTAQTSSDRSRLKKQKEYRRAKLSKQKRTEFLLKAKKVGQWGLVGLILLLLLNASRINSYQYIGLTGLSDADKQVVTSLTDDYIGGLNRFKLFFDKTDYQQYIESNASFASRVEASTSVFSTTLKIRVVPKQVAHSYRTSAAPDENSGLWLAQDGSLIELSEEQIFDMGQDVPTTYVLDRSGVAYQPGEFVTSVANLDYLSKLAVSLAREGVQVVGFDFLDTPREFRVQVAGEKYYLLVSFERSIASVVADYELAKTEIKATNKNIETYVDLRVPDKVFYR